MSNMNELVKVSGHEVPFSAALALMDDDLREEVYAAIAPCAEQDFIDAYARLHAEKFGDEFVVN